ncbi:MAG: nitroreductase family protein [Treponemataceae bacterium]
MNMIIDTIKKRRSCRSYLSRTVRRKDIETIVEAGTWAPSAHNSQPWRFTVILDTKILQEMNNHIKTKLEKPADYSFYYNAPSLIIVSQPKDPSLAAANCACALQNMFLIAESLNLGSCWINQINHTCNDTEVRSILSSFGIPENHEVYGCISLGYATDRLPVVARKEIPVNWIE